MGTLIVIGISIFAIILLVAPNKRNDFEEKRTFQGMDVEEYIKNEVGEEYYNKHYKK